jgi:Terminase large subunit, T4likevirus-type, N-terminal
MPTYKLESGGMHEKFLNLRTKIQMLGGGFGNGKTAASCVKAIKLALDYPGSSGLIARETYPKLNDTIRKEFYKWIPHSIVKRWPTKDDNTMVLKNGSIINFRYIAQRGKQTVDGQTTSNLLSATYDWIVVDQIEDPSIQYKDFLDLLGRLRGSASYKGDDPTMPMTGPRWLIITCNPTANWVYKKLVKPYHRYLATGLVDDELIHNPDTLEPMITILEGSTYENRKNVGEDFIKLLEATYKGQMKDRFLLGQWAAYEGLVYPDFDPLVHMVPKDTLMNILYKAADHKTKLTAVEGFDLGLVSPSAYVLGFTDHRGRLFILDAYYKPTPRIEDAAMAILSIRDKYYDYLNFDDPIWCDPAIFRRTVINSSGKGADTVARILSNDYDLYLKPGQNDITSGIMKVTEYLAPVVGMHFDETPDGPEKGPLLYFNHELTMVEDEIQSYFWKTSPDGDRIDEPKDGNDHFLDALKYMLSKLPEASKLLYEIPKAKPEWMKWQEAE